MTESELTLGWPGTPSVILLQREGDEAHVVAHAGDLDEPRPWASVSKVAVALACALESDEGRLGDDDVVADNGATVSQLLSHCGGFGLEEADPRYTPGSRRVYSNVGIDKVVDAARRGREWTEWLTERVVGPLGLTTTVMSGRPSSGLAGSTSDLARLAGEWLIPRLVSPARDRLVTTPYGASLSGVVPGFGRFDPCPWGLGPEIHGTKDHWMRSWAPTAFGHFGQSGALLLVDRDAGRALVATSSVAFGPWARELWPDWSARMRVFAP